MTPLTGSPGGPWVGRGLLAVAAVCAIVRLLQMLAGARYGIDFTDEGYYLVWIRQPFSYPFSVTQFGFLYHPVDEWLGGDVARLRQANILVTWFLAWLLTIAFFRAVLADRASSDCWRTVPMLTLAAVIATTFPNLLGEWLPTPSYNSLALQAMLVTGIGLLLAERSVTAVSVLGWVLVGIGGWLAFMAKPSTAGAVAAVVLAYLALARKLQLSLIGCAVLVALLLLWASAVAIDGSAAGFVGRVVGGWELIRVMGVEQPMHQLFRIDFLRIGTPEAVLAIATTILVVLAALGASRANPQAWRLGLVAVLLLAGAILSLTFGIAAPDTGGWKFRGLAAVAIPCAALVCAVALQRRQWAGGFAHVHGSLALVFAVFPHVYAFGSGNNYWHTGASAGIFWVLAGLAVFVATIDRPVTWRVFLPFALGAQLVGILTVQSAMRHPYRQHQALAHDAREVAFGDRGSRLLLGAGFAGYVSELGRGASAAGFQPGTPVIDLTGHSPGSLFGLGANAVGQPWLLGGYPGSERYALKALALVPCEQMARAWVLIEPGGPRPLPAARVLSSAGLRLEQDYGEAVSLTRPSGFGGYPETSIQKLLKPVLPVSQALEVCRQAQATAR